MRNVFLTIVLISVAGKKGKKQKGKTLVLSEFLAEDHGGLAGQAVVMAPSKSSWADEMVEDGNKVSHIFLTSSTHFASFDL